MTVPPYSAYLKPLLQYAGDGEEHQIRDATAAIADYLGISEQDRNELVPKGNQPVLNYRVHWANTYLKKAKLLESTGRGRFKITERGLSVLRQDPDKIDRSYLMQFSEFESFATSSRTKSTQDDSQVEEADQTPKELLISVYQSLRKELADELLEYVLGASPAFFERLVVDLLLAMGYGGSLEDAGHAIGTSGDGGIDGYIQEDRLGLSTVYIQAKRYAPENRVQRPQVQGFAGSLTGMGATKGVFITTSD